VNSGFPHKTNFAYELIFIGHERKANIFENCMCQQVNKAKNTADKQHSPGFWLLLTAFVRSDKKSFSFIVNEAK